MTKQIEDYPKLDRWLDNNALSGIECSKSEYYAPFDAVSAKMLEMQQQIDSLTEQNKQLQQENKQRTLLSANLHNFLFNHASSIPDGLFYKLRGMLREFTLDVKDSNND